MLNLDLTSVGLPTPDPHPRGSPTGTTGSPHAALRQDSGGRFARRGSPLWTPGTIRCSHRRCTAADSHVRPCRTPVAMTQRATTPLVEARP